MRYSFIHRGNVLPLSHGTTLIGRSVACKVVLDDADVSRRHARLTISAAGAEIEDLDSANGVRVNDEAIAGRRRLANGDRIRVGREELQLIIDNPPGREAVDRAAAGRGPPGRAAALDAFWDDQGTEGADYGQPTAVNQRVHLLTEAMQQLLASGQVDSGDPLLLEQMTELLERAEAGAPLEQRHVDTAALVALRLARHCREARWVEYVISLHGAIGLALPSVTLDELEALVGTIPPLAEPVLRGYVERVRARSRQLSPSERQGLERFERVAARLRGPR